MISVLTAQPAAGGAVSARDARVLRMLSNFDDYFSWFITALVMVTGLMATAHIGALVPEPARRAHPELRCAADLVPVRQADARVLYLSLTRRQRRAARPQGSHFMSDASGDARRRSRAGEQRRPGGARRRRDARVRAGDRRASAPFVSSPAFTAASVRRCLPFLHRHRGSAIHADLEGGAVQAGLQARGQPIRPAVSAARPEA